MIKMYRNEYSDGKYAYRTYKLTFLWIPIYRACYKTTNRSAIATLKSVENNTLSVKGFKL